MNNFNDYFFNNLKKIIKESNSLSFKNTERLFVITINDFVNEKIDIKDLSYVATQLYYELNKPSDFDKNNNAQKLGNILSQVSELEFYSSNQDSAHNKKMIEGILKSIHEYHNLIE